MWGNNYPYNNNMNMGMNMGVNTNYNQPTMNNAYIPVQGYDGAKYYQMSPNSRAFLKDEINQDYLYIKTTDNIGVASIETYTKAEAPAAPSKDLTDYVRKDELMTLIKELSGGSKDE